MRDDDFVADLLARMTPDEKIGQLNLLSAGEGPGTGSPQSRDVAARLAEGRLGGLFGCKSVDSVRAWQELALEGSRLRIPLLFAEDVIHGHRTVFPLPIALACSFDLALIRATARIAAREAAAEGIAQVYAPMIDVCRDPRWGRIAESPGEDPFLAARYAEAMVEGLQGDDPAAPTPWPHASSTSWPTGPPRAGATTPTPACRSRTCSRSTRSPSGRASRRARSR